MNHEKYEVYDNKWLKDRAKTLEAIQHNIEYKLSPVYIPILQAKKHELQLELAKIVAMIENIDDQITSYDPASLAKDLILTQLERTVVATRLQDTHYIDEHPKNTVQRIIGKSL